MMEVDPTRAAILQADGHLLIEGGPGCGKTTIALMRAQVELGTLLPEQKILFLSFSRAAVRQIIDRLKEILDRGTRTRLEVRMFHAFFLDVVRAHSPEITGVPARFVTPDQEQRLRFDFDGDWEKYTAKMAQEGQFVFDRLADTAATLLEGSRVLCDLYCSTYPVVIVDEFQDTNIDQWRFVKAISKGSRIVALADPDQRIYEGFVKGVDEHRTEEFRESLAPKEFDLGGDNYRSPIAGILGFANAVLSADGDAVSPESVQTIYYPFAKDFESYAHRAVAWLNDRLTNRLGHEPTIAVLSADNASVSLISQELTTSTITPNGKVVPPIDHQLHFEAELAVAGGYVVATILEWPTLNRNEAVEQTLNVCIDYYRTVGGSTARNKVVVLARGRDAFLKSATVRSKSAAYLIDQFDAGIPYRGAPLIDWSLALNVLTGTTELSEMFRRARSLRMQDAGSDLAWALLQVWDGGGGYLGATGVVRRVMAERMLDDSRTEQAHVNLMNMYRSKGKEFDGVVIAEGWYRSRLLDRAEHYPPHSSRRRVLRVALTRARHEVLLIRPQGSLALTRVPEV